MALVVAVGSACLPRTIVNCSQDEHCTTPEICQDGQCHLRADNASSSGMVGSSSSSGMASSSSGVVSACPPPVPLLTGVTADLNGTFAVDDCDVWAVGENNTVIHWDGSGVETVTGPFSGRDLQAVWADATGVWVVGDEPGMGSALFTATLERTSMNWTPVPGSITCDSWHPRMLKDPGGALWLSCPDIAGSGGDIYAWDATNSVWTARTEGFAVWSHAGHVYVASTDGVHDNGARMPGSPTNGAAVAVVDGVLTVWRSAGAGWGRQVLVNNTWMDDGAHSMFRLNRFDDARWVGINGWSGNRALVWGRGSSWLTVDSASTRVGDVAVTQTYVWFALPGGVLRPIAW